MKKLQLFDFQSQSISRNATATITGGQSFCEWYFDYCNRNGIKYDSAVLQHFMYADKMNGNQIPNGTDMNMYEMKLDNYHGI